MTVRDITSLLGSGGVVDPYFENVSLLLQGDGTNGAQNNTFLDSSTNNFTIIRNGNTTQGTFSPYGNLWSNYFDGSGDYLTVPYNSTAFQFAGDFTIECWINPSARLVSYPTVFSNYSSFTSNGLIALFAGHADTPTKWGVAVNGVNNVLVSTSTIAYGTWTHIAISRSGSTMRLFVNGVSEASATNTTTITGTANNWWIGAAGDNPTGTNLYGSISNVRIVKGTALYTSNFTPSTTPLIAVSGTSLLTCQSNRFIDNSSNNFTLTVNGNTSVQRFSPFNPTAPYSAATIGGSGYFDGSGDYLSVSTASASGDLTMEFWVYPTTSISSSNYGLFAASDQRFGMITVSGNLYFLTSSDINTSTPLKVGMWSHVAISKNSGTIRIFLNGVQIASGSNSDTATGNWRIASDQSGEIFPACYMSDVRYIVGTGLYTTAFTPPTAPLTSTGAQTKLLCNFTNAGIPDAAMMNDLETVGNAQVSTSVKKYGTGSIYIPYDTSSVRVKPNDNKFSFGTGAFTIETWVNVTTATPNGWFLVSSNDPYTSDSELGWLLGYNVAATDKFTAWYNNNGSNVTLTTTNTFSTGTWYHVALTYDQTTLRLFVNGNLEASATGSYNNNRANQVLFVSWAPIGGVRFSGYIDDLRITKGFARYTANFTPPTQALPTN